MVATLSALTAAVDRGRMQQLAADALIARTTVLLAETRTEQDRMVVLRSEALALRKTSALRRRRRARQAGRVQSPDLDTLHAWYAESRDPSARDQLVQAHAALAHGLVSRFLHRGEATDDLQQVAMLALVRAVERFDPSRGLQFSTFATPTVLGELKRHFRDRAWAIRLPRRIHDRYLAVQRERDDLAQELGRSPTVRELAARAGLSEEDVLETVEAADARGLASLDTPRPGEDNGDMFAVLGSDDEGLGHIDRRVTLERLLARLGPDDREVIRMRFYDGMTQLQIAEKLGTNQMHVSRALTRSLRRLRALADN